MSVKNGEKGDTALMSTYFHNLHKPHLCFSLSKALGGVSLKYAFKLMQDLIVRLHSLSSDPLSASLASFVITSNLLLPSTISHCLAQSTLAPSHTHLSSPPPHRPLFSV